MTLMSLAPDRESCRVRGIGVAVIVRASTLVLRSLILFLMVDPEALLLVDHQQTNGISPEFNIVGEQAMGTNDHIDHALGQIVNGGLLLPGRAKTAQYLDPYRIMSETLFKCMLVLLGENGGGHQNRHLLSVLDRLELP